MRLEGGAMRLSASDLMRFSGCPHATAFDVEHAHGRGPGSDGNDAETAIIQRKGLEHEARVLAGLKASGLRVAELPAGGDIVAQATGLGHILRDGRDVVYQAPLSGGLDGAHLWGGRSDFLHRVERPSALGAFSYEVADTKLKREATPAHVLQLAVYSDLLAEVQGVAPSQARVVLGTGEAVAVRLDDYGAYARRLRRRLEAFVDEPWETRSVPCAECATCRWTSRCEADWRATDSLFGVANITRPQVAKLEAAGILTLEALARHEGEIKGLSLAVREKLALQARLQHARKTGEPHFELKPFVPGRGFGLLPEPDPGDVFYDIEGDPHHPDGGLEYLHGVRTSGRFQAFWAHDREKEGRSLRELFAFFEASFAGRPEARVYHYAPYEVTALKRLTRRHGWGEPLLDRWLRERRFVDLFAVVRGAIVASEENYSIKSLERLYGLRRDGDVTTSMGSVVAYHAWKDTRDQAILDGIEAYNDVDCLSTEELRDWLVEVRPADAAWPDFKVDQEKVDGRTAEQVADEAAVDALVAPVVDPERRAAFRDLAFFHDREEKPAWWAVFESLGRDPEDLVDDLDALGGLQALGPAEPGPEGKGFRRRYAFPAQETKIRAGKDVTTPGEGRVERLKVVELLRREGEVVLHAGDGALLRDAMTLHPPMPIPTDVIRDGLREVLRDQISEAKLSAMGDLLARRAPRLRGGTVQDLLNGHDVVEGVRAAVMAMDGTVLPVQGPPGTGKTYVSARAILALVAAGHRVGVTASTHDAIRNLLEGCVAAASAPGVGTLPTIVHKGSGTTPYEAGAPIAWTASNGSAALRKAPIVGSTAWFFSRDDQVGAFDWLFVDEAGQMSLATLLGMGRAARNVVLVGDPQQLPQVIQAAHPGSAGLSCLEWVLDGARTLPPDRGVFLSVSRRMHPDVCGFVSERSYEGRLASHPDTARQAITGTPWPTIGAHWVPVGHEGRAQVSDEEVDTLAGAARDLVGGLWTDRDGRTRPMSEDDVIVVAPYNAQVNAIRDALDAVELTGVRVGTVDKFQGQEAAACLVSMTASSAEQSPRGIEFLLSLNRINVAVSRAKALALVFGSDRLLDAACRTLEQMRLANTLCALAEGSTLGR